MLRYLRVFNFKFLKKLFIMEYLIDWGSEGISLEDSKKVIVNKDLHEHLPGVPFN